MSQATESRNIAPKLKHNKLREALKCQIRDGRYSVGDRLPTEAELVKSMGVSRHTVLRGLTMLAAEGWVTREQGRGTFVARRSDLRPTSVKTVALICSDHGDALMSRVIRGVSRALRAHQRELLILDSGHEAEREAALLEELPRRGVGGALLWAMAPAKNREMICDLEAQGYPLVLIDHSVEGCGLPVVCVDHERGAYEVTQHLISLGHRRIAHLTAEAGEEGPSRAVAAREVGYRRALAEAGLSCEPWMVARVNPALMRMSHDPSLRQVLAYEATHRLLVREDRPTAIFMLNDLFFPSVLSAATNQQLQVPKDIALAGFNNDPEAWQQSLSLTSYDQPTEQVGFVATELLRKQMDGEAVNSGDHMLAGELVVRSSTQGGSVGLNGV